MAGERYVDILAGPMVKGPGNAVRIAADVQGVLWQSIKGAPFSTLGGGGGADSPAMAALLARGYTRLGSAITPARTKAFAEDFTEVGWDDASGTKAWTVPSGVVGGGFLRGGVGTNSLVVRGVGNATAGLQRIPRVVALDEITPWWMAFEFRVNTPGAGNNWCLFGMRDPGSNIAANVGYYSPGPGGNAHFAGYLFSTAEDDAVSTVAVDGNPHSGEIWFDGTSYRLSIDQESPVVFVHSHPFTGTPVAPCWNYNFSASGSADVFARAAIWPVAYTA